MEALFSHLWEWQNICLYVFFFVLGLLWRKGFRIIEEDICDLSLLPYLLFLTIVMVGGSIEGYNHNILEKDVINLVCVFGFVITFIVWFWATIGLFWDNGILTLISIITGIIVGSIIGRGCWRLSLESLIFLLLGIAISFLYLHPQKPTKKWHMFHTPTVVVGVFFMLKKKNFWLFIVLWQEAKYRLSFSRYQGNKKNTLFEKKTTIILAWC